jgi:dethiobiotin synthetase
MSKVNRSVFFITGTDTGVGKTVLTCLLVRYLRKAGAAAIGLKPVCSGDRDDARRLHAASDAVLSLDEINPWHFRAPLAPLLAARREKQRLQLSSVLDHVRRIQKQFPILLVEGAGGLLSPLGEGFDSRELIQRLRAIPIVVCWNQLGAVNQVRLVLDVLPPGFSQCARIVLMTPARTDLATESNAQLIRELTRNRQVHVLPRLKSAVHLENALNDRRIRQTLSSILRPLPKRGTPKPT